MPLARYFFMIVEKNPFFANDLEACLKEADPLVESVIVTTPDDVMGAADILADAGAHGRKLIFLTSCGLTAIQAAGLDSFATQTGAVIVMRQDSQGAAEAEGLGWLMLPSPFTPDALYDLVQQLNARLAA